MGGDAVCIGSTSPVSVTRTSARWRFCFLPPWRHMRQRVGDGGQFDEFSGGAAIYPCMPLTRHCPECGETLIYANLPGYRRACREKFVCRRCAASPCVIQKKIAEDEERRAARIGAGNPLAVFFERVEASLSGSARR